MKDWSAEKIIAVGITGSLVLTVIGSDTVAIMNGSMEITGLCKEIAIGLFGYMGRGAVQSMQQQIQSKTGEALEKVAKTATETKKAVEAVENIKDIVKK